MKKVTITNKKPDGSPGWLDGAEASILMSQTDALLDLEHALAYVAEESEFRKGYVTPLQNHENTVWVVASAYPIQPNMSDADLDHWLDLIALRG